MHAVKFSGLACFVSLIFWNLSSAAEPIPKPEASANTQTLEQLFEKRQPLQTQEVNGVLYEFFGCTKKKPQPATQEPDMMTVRCQLRVSNKTQEKVLHNFTPGDTWQADTNRGGGTKTSTKAVFNDKDYDKAPPIGSWTTYTMVFDVLKEKPLLLSYDFVVSNKVAEFVQLTMNGGILFKDIKISEEK
ncbi:MAG: hypothetical protein ACKN9T_15625 [Candidatus Methylumidiphilus sp.]